MRGYCGINCDECPALKATINNDNQLRKKTAATWSSEFNAKIKAENINCLGCKKNDVLFDYCQQCKVRKCASTKNIVNCGFCEEFPCEFLDKFLEPIPEERKYLENIHKNVK